MLMRATPPITEPAITAGLVRVLSVAGLGGGEELVCAGEDVLELADAAEDAEDVEDGADNVVVAGELAGRLLMSALLAGGCSM